MKVVAVGLVLPNPLLIMSVPSLMIQLESLEPNIIAFVAEDIKDIFLKTGRRQLENAGVTMDYH